MSLHEFFTHLITIIPLAVLFVAIVFLLVVGAEHIVYDHLIFGWIK